MTLASMAMRQAMFAGSGERRNDPTKGQFSGPRMKAIKATNGKGWDRVEITFPYSQEAVNHLKSVIPARHRQWINERKAWRVDRECFIDLYLMFPQAIMTPPVAREATKYINSIRPQILKPWTDKYATIPGIRDVVFRDYQQSAIEFMMARQEAVDWWSLGDGNPSFIMSGGKKARGRHNLIADEQGLGKTLISLGYTAALSEEIPYEEVTGLIICPDKAKFSTWAWEHIEEYTDWDYVVIDGGTKKMPEQFGKDVNWYIMNWEATRRAGPWIHNILWDVVIVDECHRMGNPDSQQTQAIMPIKAKHKVPMSGTAAQNRLDQYWPSLKWIGWTKSEFEEFKAEHYVVQKYQPRRGPAREKVVAYKNMDGFIKKLAKRQVRRTQDEVFKDLPGLQVIPQWVDMHPEQKKIYNQLCEQGMLEFSEGRVKNYNDFRNVVGMTLMVCQSPAITELKELMEDPETGRMRLMGTGVFGPDVSYKMDETVEHAKEILQRGDKVVMFSAYRRTCDLWAERLQGITDYVMVRGGVAARKAAEEKKRFQYDDNVGAYIGTIDANKESITLTPAKDIILAGLVWDPGPNEQAFFRIKRKDKLMEAMIAKLAAENKKLRLFAHDYIVAGTTEVWHRQQLEGKAGVLGLGRLDPNAPVTRDMEKEASKILQPI